MSTAWITTLRKWTDTLKYIRTAREKDLWEMLKHEMSHGRRQSVALRVYGKANELRAHRERKEIAKRLAT